MEGRDRLHVQRPNVRPKLAAASLDAEHSVTVRFTHRLPVADWPKAKFKLTTAPGGSVRIKTVVPVRPRKGRSAVYSVTTVEPLDFIKHTYEVQAAGMDRLGVRLGCVLWDSDAFYDPDAVLGASYTPRETTFRVFAPTAASVRVVIADELDGNGGLAEHDMQRGNKGIWGATIRGDLVGKYYAYKLAGSGFDPQAEITDIYATCAQGCHARSLIVDLSKTDPPGFRSHEYGGPASPADAVLYELHVRDFTIAANSGVTDKGKFSGLAESGTCLPGDRSIKTGLDHLVELGITHVQLMPVQDFDNFERRQEACDWGYMPVHFNSPEGWYATRVTGPAKISEFKQVVKAMHDRGIGVILDVAYNHTAASARFEKLVPGYYFRMTRGGRFSNGSGCGNEFASEHPMARKFILDSVRFWVQEYEIDGFRFDLMGLIDLETMKQIKEEISKMRPGILVYGEPWTAGVTRLSPVTGTRRVRGTGIAAFNEHFRDAIKGDRDGGAPGFVQVGDRRDGVIHGLSGAIRDWSIHPADAINYFEAHDNLTAWDKLLQSVPKASDRMRRRMMRFAALILFSSQGLVFMHSGQEFCRSKKGSPNSYNLPDEINQIDWSLKKTNRDVCAYHRGLIAFRRTHPLLRLRTREQVESRASLLDPPHENCVAYHLDGFGLKGESADEILVLLNGRNRTIAFKLPRGAWSIHADADRAGVGELGQATRKATLPAHSGMVLVR